MQLKSIQTRIALLSGLCVLTATAVLVGYGTFAARNSQAYVSEQVQDLSDRGTRERLQTLASTQAGVIRSKLNHAFDTARNMARAFEIIAADETKSATPSADRRTQLNAILLNALKDNPEFNGTYSAWEPDALDGQDAAFRSHAEVGSDATGRFLPYWTRDASGHIAIQPLVEYDSHALHPNGVMKGGWYIGPQNGGGESILDPLPYIVQGKNVYLATMSVPITIDGKFRGVAGADFDLSFVQQIAKEVNASLYNGKGMVSIVSYKGLVVASSDHPEWVGQAAQQGVPNWTQYLPIVQAGREQVAMDAETDSFKAFAPIILGRTQTPWSVVITVPRAVAMADATALGSALNSRNRNDTVLQFLVALVIGAAGVGGMWMAARSISTPIADMTTTMRRLADGDLSTEIPSIGRSDEIGEMAGAVQVFKTNAVERARAEREAESHRTAADGERERSAAEKARAAQEQSEAMRKLGEGLRKLATGDLTARLDPDFAAAYAQIRDDFNEAGQKLMETVRAVVSSTSAIHSGTREISAASDDLSARTERQAASIEETAAALSEITTMLQKSADGAKHASEVVDSADKDAKNGAVVVSKAVEAMDAIAKSSQQIGQIIGVIDEIAFQTNLLALNAGVEAARAGEAGRGFAVVASEVRALAQRSAQAAKEIKELISTSTSQVDSGVTLVAETGETLKRIITQVSEINHVVAAIAAGAHEQANGISEVNTAITQMDQTTQQNATMVEQSTAATHSLSQETNQLASLIEQFRVDSDKISALRGPQEKTPARAA